MPASARRAFAEEQLRKNVRAFVDAINKAKPSGAKGTYIKQGLVELDHGAGREGGSRASVPAEQERAGCLNENFRRRDRVGMTGFGGDGKWPACPPVRDCRRPSRWDLKVQGLHRRDRDSVSEAGLSGSSEGRLELPGTGEPDHGRVSGRAIVQPGRTGA